MHFSSLWSSVAQIGSGVPQYRERDRFQSTRFSSHLPKRPEPVLAGFLQRDQPVFDGRRFDEPRVQRVVQHRFIGTPAMRIVVRVLFDLEYFVLEFQLHAQVDVERRIVVRQLRIVSVLDETAFVFFVGSRIDMGFHELRIHVRDQEKFPGAVDHRLAFAGAVGHHQRGDSVLPGYAVVIGAERRSDVHDSRRAVVGRHEVGMRRRPA